MATEIEARKAKRRMVTDGEALLGMRPRAVGIIATQDGGHVLKVTLPAVPRRKLLDMLGRVRVVYDYADAPAVFAGVAEPSWMRAVERAKRKAAGG